MIKLGVFDLDGTLLNSEGRLPETFYDDVEWLRRRGVSVAIASARPVQFLFEMFDRDVDLLLNWLQKFMKLPPDAMTSRSSAPDRTISLFPKSTTGVSSNGV